MSLICGIVFRAQLNPPFGFLKGYDCAYIYQDEKEKSKFHCMMWHPGSKDRKKVTLSMQEREKLELALIADPAVKVEPVHIMFKPPKYKTEG